MLILDSSYVQKLNANYSAGLFLKAVDLIEDYTTNPITHSYWIDHFEPVTWNGNTYQPLQMVWNNLKTSQTMPIETGMITVSNLANLAGKYLKRRDVTENEATLHLLHLDLLNLITGHWQRKVEVMGVNGDENAVVFTVGRQIGRNYLPRKIYLASEFPGLAAGIPKITG